MDQKDLEQAFTLFSQASEQLSGAYQALQQRVERLTEELEIVNGELRRQLNEKAALTDRLRSLLAALPAGVIVLNDDHVQDSNAAARQMLPEALPGAAWAPVFKARFAKTAMPLEWELIDASGATRRVTLSENPLQSEAARILLIHDITEAHATQLALQRHQRLSAMGEMAARLAHQLRTPLAAAMLYTSNLSQAHLSESDRARFVERAASRLRHLESLIQDMLSFVKGEIETKEWIPVAGLLADLQQSIEPELRHRGIVMTVKDESREGGVLGNREALTGAFLNLLENAAQACSHDGQIELTARSEGATVEVVVADNGCGVDAQLHEKLFEPFFTTRTEGTGLGLAIVRGVVNAHGGEIELRSEPAHGSEFIVRLPHAAP